MDRLTVMPFNRRNHGPRTMGRRGRCTECACDAEFTVDVKTGPAEPWRASYCGPCLLKVISYRVQRHPVEILVV